MCMEPLFSKSSSDRGSFAIWAGCFQLQILITETMTGKLMLRNYNIFRCDHGIMAMLLQKIILWSYMMKYLWIKLCDA